MQSSAVLTSIAARITPYVGEVMARSSTELYARRLGINGGAIDRPQLEELLRQLSLGLNIFIGRDKTATLIGEIRTSLGAHA